MNPFESISPEKYLDTIQALRKEGAEDGQLGPSDVQEYLKGETKSLLQEIEE